MSKQNLLKGTRVYLSGPMDFVASRQIEKESGWRSKISGYLKSNGVTVFDPWDKPDVVGIHEYGKEDVKSLEIRDIWSYGNKEEDSNARGRCADQFRQTVHIDLRMVDISDFIIAYCPTNIYSVGTVHEIIAARQQKKPVLFVSPKVEYPTYEKLKEKSKNNTELYDLIIELGKELPIKSNNKGIPSLWYIPLLNTENIFDGFGFRLLAYKDHFNSEKLSSLDSQEESDPPQRPLLDFIDKLINGDFPKRWDRNNEKYIDDDDWLILTKSIT